MDRAGAALEEIGDVLTINTRIAGENGVARCIGIGS